MRHVTVERARSTADPLWRTGYQAEGPERDHACETRRSRVPEQGVRQVDRAAHLAADEVGVDGDGGRLGACGLVALRPALEHPIAERGDLRHRTLVDRPP